MALPCRCANLSPGVDSLLNCTIFMLLNNFVHRPISHALNPKLLKSNRDGSESRAEWGTSGSWAAPASPGGGLAVGALAL